MRIIKAFLVVLFGFSWLAPAQAADVPANLIVDAGGFEWAWAAPCSPVAPSCGATPLAMHDGWGLATAEQFLASFSSFADLLAKFADGSGGVLCASAYFNSGYSHCDQGDAAIGAVYNAPAAWAYAGGAESQWESFVTRGGQVPEPGTMVLLALGLLGAGLAARRQHR